MNTLEQAILGPIRSELIGTMQYSTLFAARQLQKTLRK